MRELNTLPTIGLAILLVICGDAAAQGAHGGPGPASAGAQHGVLQDSPSQSMTATHERAKYRDQARDQQRLRDREHDRLCEQDQSLAMEQAPLREQRQQRLLDGEVAQVRERELPLQQDEARLQER